MIQLSHIGTGALAGTQCNGPIEALLTGVTLHGLMDVAPHGEVDDMGWELVSAVTAIGALIARLGLRSPVVWGAVGGVLPDLEHVLPKPVRSEEGLYPTHRIKWLHSSNTPLALPAWAQVVLGGAVVGAFAMRRRPKPPATGLRARLRNASR